jgi:hypothetical protein
VTPYYTFSLTQQQVVRVHVSRKSVPLGSIACRLYRIENDGFSNEYYLGISDGTECFITAALQPGNWQLQVEVPVKGVLYSLSVDTGSGDGNDGFSQAAALPLGELRVGSLGENDLEDWYTFVVKSDAQTVQKGGKDLTVNVVSTSTLGCLIYPLQDVDIFGFQGPVCGLAYRYPPGTYMVTVRHLPPRSIRATYSIGVR